MIEATEKKLPVYGPHLPDYRTFRDAGFKFSAVAVAIRLVTFFAMAMSSKSEIVIKYFLDFIPYPVVFIDGTGFSKLVSQSTLYTAIGSLALLLIVAFKRNRRDQFVVGCFMASVSSAETLLIDVIRHIFWPPVTIYSTVLWTLWPLALSVVVMFLIGKLKAAA
jgi:hypothetical protein